MRALHIGATGMLSQQFMVETIANNVANLNTTGFKKSRTVFQDLFYQNFRQVGVASSRDNTTVPVGVQVGLGTKISGVYRIHTSGNMLPTDNSLDIAINGRGYFQIQHPSGETAYSRAGSLQLDQDGFLVTVDGYRVLPGAQIPPGATDITINQSGQIYAKQDGQLQAQQVGQIQLALFANDAGLEALGDNLYRESVASGRATVNAPGSEGYGLVLQGFLETSNVEAVEEITTMISAQRAYEMNSKVIETADQISATATNIR